MRYESDLLWTRLVPRRLWGADPDEWVQHGGKWIVFDRKENLVELARGLEPYIEGGEVEGAKYWRRDPGAICVYSLDRDRERVEGILDALGAARSRVWEYDYATAKNVSRPLSFLYSWANKMRTILQSYGIRGTLWLIAEVLKPRERP
jgi:hypothetical protein